MAWVPLFLFYRVYVAGSPYKKHKNVPLVGLQITHNIVLLFNLQDIIVWLVYHRFHAHKEHLITGPELKMNLSVRGVRQAVTVKESETQCHQVHRVFLLL